MNAQWERTYALTGNETLIAITVEELTDYPLYVPGHGRCQRAIIRGESTDSTASFEFGTGALTPVNAERFEQLGEHGFTVVTPPDDWRYQLSPLKWQNDVIVKALDQIVKPALEQKRGRTSGYDHELAKSVLNSLNESYPEPMALIELKYQFNEQPSDEVLSAVLNALRGDRYITGERKLHRKARLNPFERTTLTAEGRRHLADEMKRKSNAQQDYTINDAARFILSQLLSEFREKKFTTSDLWKTYKGLSPKELKDRGVAAGISEVDFDLAMGDLIGKSLIDTGPKEHVKNNPYSDVVFVGFFTSKNEYSHLTENGYREAVQLDSQSRERRGGSPAHTKTTIHGDQYINFGQAGAIGPNSTGTLNYQKQWATIQNQVDFNALTGELEQLRRHLQQSASSSLDYQQLALLSEAEEHVKKHDGSKAIEVLSKIGKGALDAAKDIGTEIAAKVIARSMGLEP
ncbi:MAG TPA: hypothetical protein VGR47_08720 [Terracidiphilus sp.]|nr:hypothetical protein [Terracidiphilus sp.]